MDTRSLASLARLIERAPPLMVYEQPLVAAQFRHL
jgi:hypothetical protein